MNGEKLYSLKPVFIGIKNIVVNGIRIIPVTAFLSLWLSLFLSSIKNSTPGLVLLTFLGFSILLYLGLLLFNFVNEKYNYKLTEYSVYQDRVDFTEGFINSKFTTLLLKDIKEVHLEKTFFQKFWDLGTIRFITSANTGNANRNNFLLLGVYETGVNFRDIKNSDEIYKVVKELIDKKRAE